MFFSVNIFPRLSVFLCCQKYAYVCDAFLDLCKELLPHCQIDRASHHFLSKYFLDYFKLCKRFLEWDVFSGKSKFTHHIVQIHWNNYKLGSKARVKSVSLHVYHLELIRNE